MAGLLPLRPQVMLVQGGGSRGMVAVVQHIIREEGLKAPVKTRETRKTGAGSIAIPKNKKKLGIRGGNISFKMCFLHIAVCAPIMIKNDQVPSR